MITDGDLVSFSFDFTASISASCFWDEKTQSYVIPIKNLIASKEGMRVHGFLQASCSDRFARVLHWNEIDKIDKKVEVEVEVEVEDRFQNLNWET